MVLPQWFDPRRAVHEHDIMCLVCGKCFRQLTNTHLRSHDLTTASYKIRFGYNRRRPLMSQALLQMYAARAIQSNLASRIRCRPIVSNPELRKQGGHRPIALEEVLARRDAQLRRREELRAAAAQRRARARARVDEAGPAEPPRAADRDLEANRSPVHPQVVGRALMSAAAPGSPQPGAHASRGSLPLWRIEVSRFAEYRSA